MLQAVTPNDPCAVCGKAFIRFSTFESAVICGAKRCLSGYVKGLDKTRKDDLKRRKEAVKTRSEHIADLQKVVNSYVRLRDVSAGYGCIDCGKPFEKQKLGGSVDAGHYLSRSQAPHLRFDAARNIFAQRKNCNMPGGTTRAAFREGVIARIGLEAVEALEADQSSPKWTIPELQAMKATYRALTRQLLKERE